MGREIRSESGSSTGQVAAFEVNLPQCLAHNGGLAGLARPEQGNKLPGRLGKPAVERGDLRTLEGVPYRLNYTTE